MHSAESRPVPGDVYSLREVGRAAGLGPAEVHDRLSDLGLAVAGDYLPEDEAVRLVRVLSGRSAIAASDRAALTALRDRPRRSGLSLTMSGALHAAFVLVLALATTFGWLSADDTEELIVNEPPARLVYLMTPGPGGGGGGGGMKMAAPPPPAEQEAAKPDPEPTPVPPVRRTPPPRPPRPLSQRPPVRVTPAPEIPKTVAPPAPPSPAVFAPVRSVSSSALTRSGLLDLGRAPAPPSSGPGDGGGVGSGRGTGTGEGQGSGIGPGSGGGTGGGPFRPGSGITPPTLVREVRPVYTAEARRRGIEGDVALQIVVRSDGSVGDVRIIRSLDAGLDRQAIAAVRQWKFGPARRQGAAVDVVVDVSVAFTLR